MNTQVRVLSLAAKSDGSSVLYRLEQGSVLQFRPGPTLLGCRIDLFTNHPLEASEGSAFHRETFRRLSWKFEAGNERDDTGAYVNLPLVVAGSFKYYFTCDSEDVGGSGYFLVDPILRTGHDSKVLPLDSLQCQSVLAKNLGHINTWEGKLRVAKECGYNMIHFTPVQVLGGSRSAYSLADQHDLNPHFSATWDDLESLVSRMEREWGVLSLCDIVLNHTANETPWIRDHVDVTYNCLNCPHLRPAFLLDRVLARLSADIEDGKWVDRGLPKGEVNTEEHLDTVRALLYDNYLPQVNLYEFFLVDTSEILDAFEKKVMKLDPPESCHGNIAEGEGPLRIIPDPEYRRFKAAVDLDLAVRMYNLHKNDCYSEEERILKCSSDFKRHLDRLNHDAYNEVWGHVNAAIDNVIKGARYHRVDPDGDRTTDCTRRIPLVCQYFLGPQGDFSLAEEEKLMFSPEGAQYMAHNGWVMNHDPLVNFAQPGSNVYLRRELVAWGDSVKLRFGDSVSDSPFLWNYMRKYAELTAKVFHGIRLDNCHSTPIHVAEYMLDAARKVRPDLYVIAELFTSSEATDNMFINRLGINSLIREALSAWDSHEQGRLVHRFGGEPVGSFLQLEQRPLVPAMAHALFYDQTHDNPSPVEKRTVYDLLPSAGLVSFACCGLGSNRGYDELVPHHLHVVNEARTYATWGKQVDSGTGMVAARRALNSLHMHMGVNGFNEVYVDQMDFDVVAVTRHCPITHESYVLVAHTVFSKTTDPDRLKGIKPVHVEGKLLEVTLEAKLVKTNKKEKEEFKKNDGYVNGLSDYELIMQQHVSIDRSHMARLAHAEGNHITIGLQHFPPGSVIVFHFSLSDAQLRCSEGLHRSIPQIYSPDSEFAQIVSKMSLLDLNSALFRCAQEERESIPGGGLYHLDGYGEFKYGGLQGVMSLLAEIRPKNDLGNWLPGNLRKGNWLMDYITSRLKGYNCTELGRWLDEEAFTPLRGMPRYLVPRYFDVVVTGTFFALLKHTWTHMSTFVQNGSSFVKALALGSVQHTAVQKSAPLPHLSPGLRDPPQLFEGKQLAPTLAAGLPHFSVGYMRSWGRDTFIALRGLLIIPGRYDEARWIILGYAGCLRHGLIPNLLDGGKNARFNCRDATWWWLKCILDFVGSAPDGHLILKDKVSRLFPHDTSPLTSGGHDQPLEDVMHEALQKHFHGLRFRERNAGRAIDEHMNDAGFNNEIGVDLETGFVFGGNIHNCGTWMDKMGSSEAAGNKGKPSTPRDGSAVEIVGLSYACLRGLAQLNCRGLYSYNAVERATSDGTLIKWSLEEWANKIRENFHQNFFVSRDKFDRRPDLINKTGIYKDTVGSKLPWTDYQLRPNFPIAMAVAPDLFPVEHAWKALQIVKDKLLGPLGLATLDPDDWAYRGNYDNGNQSSDPTLAHGANYHQGPEWVWPVGFFLRAYLIFARGRGGADWAGARQFVMAVLSNHFVEVQTSHWRGIPELTNASGAICSGSNPIQAWSMSCLLEVLYDFERME